MEPMPPVSVGLYDLYKGDKVRGSGPPVGSRNKALLRD